MRYIDLSRLDIRRRWVEEAERLTEELAQIHDENERAAFINRNARVWKRLKREMERISDNKCWYCESKNVRGDLAVDHYRPKIRVRRMDGTQAPGYWWLAFDHKNFRLACSHCNSPHTGAGSVTKGKADQFPLLDESNRASSPASNLGDEMPFLLDPTNFSDPSFLWFTDDGKATPSKPKTDGFLHDRALTTIEILNLNEIKIVEERMALWNHCLGLMERGDRSYEKLKNGSIAAKTEFENVVNEMHQLVQQLAQFSATACACFRGSPYDWVRQTVQ